MHSVLNDDYKKALKAKDELTVSVLRILKTAIKKKEVDLRRSLEEDECLGVIIGQAKQRRDSIEQFLNGGRDDLAAREEAELKVLEGYLPALMSNDEMETAIKVLIDESDVSGMKDMGRIMKLVMGRYKGRMDGKAAGEAVKRILASIPPAS